MAIDLDNEIPAEAVPRARLKLNDIRRRLVQKIAVFNAGTDAKIRLQTVDDLRGLRDEVLAKASVPGLVEFAQEQFGDPLLDFAAELNAVANLIQIAYELIVSNFPKDPGGFALERTFAADSSSVYQSFTRQQLSGERDAMQAVVDYINGLASP